MTCLHQTVIVKRTRTGSELRECASAPKIVHDLGDKHTRCLGVPVPWYLVDVVVCAYGPISVVTLAIVDRDLLCQPQHAKLRRPPYSHQRT